MRSGDGKSAEVLAFERLRDRAYGATYQRIADEVLAAEITEVPDGGFSGSVQDGRISKTGETAEEVRGRLGDALHREEEDEACVQRYELTGLRILAAESSDQVSLVAIERVWKLAMCDPGHFVAREIDPEPELEYETGLEPLIDWQLRALRVALEQPEAEQ